MIELEKRYPSGRLATRRVKIMLQSFGLFRVSVTGSELSTVHSTLAEAVDAQRNRIRKLEAGGWRVRKGAE